MTEIIIEVISIILTLITLGLLIRFLIKSKKFQLGSNEKDFDSIDKSIDELKKEVNTNSYETAEKVNKSLDEKIQSLTTRLDELNTKVVSQLGEIKTNNEQFKSNLTNDFTTLSDNINSKIDNKFSSTKEEVEKLKTTVQKEMSDSSKDLIENINNIKANVIAEFGDIKTNNEQFKAKVSQDFNKLSEEVKAKIDAEFNVTNEGVEKLKVSIQSEMTEFKKTSNEEIRNSYGVLLQQVNTQLNNINIEVNKKIGEGFENNTKSLSQVSESLGKITEAQKNLDKLSTEVTSLNNVLTNSQTRGRFGEVVLENILYEVFGETKGSYELQGVIKNKEREVRPDAFIYLPEPDKKLCIDSKFSFVDYKALVESKEENIELKKKFRDALKEEIKKIKEDYIIEGETAYYAIMFIPNDGIYTYLQTDDFFYNSVIDFARINDVIICSPSTLQPILANVRMLKVNFEIARNIKNVVSGINELGKETLRLSDRWDDVIKSTEKLSKDQQKLSTTIDKITKKSTAIVSKAKRDNLIEEKDLMEE